MIFIQQYKIEGSFEKISKKSQKIKKILLLLSDNYLYLVQAQTSKVIRQLAIILTGLEILDEIKCAELKMKNYLGFRLIRNQFKLEIYSEKNEQFNEWKQHLLQMCILNTFHQDFKVIKLIGEGSFANVFLGIKISNNKSYAIKAFSKQQIKQQYKGKQGLQMELKTLRRLKHESIIKLYEVYESKHSIYFIMDLLEGGELFSRFTQKGSLHINKLQKIMFNIVQTIAYLHSQLCIHRDLKPENILFKNKETYEPIIADFGLSQFLNEPILFKRCGTPGFIAPEVMTYESSEKFYTQSCDIFSLGVIFFTLIVNIQKHIFCQTGKQPFSGANYDEILENNKLAIVDYKSSGFNKVPKDLQDLIQKMLRQTPEERISADQCLKHPFFQNFIPEQENTLDFQIAQNLYQKEFLSPLQKKYQFFKSYENNDSMLLQQRRPAIKGQTNTINSFGNLQINSFKNLETQTAKPKQLSKFQQNYQSSQNQVQIQQNQNLNSVDSQEDSPSNRNITKNQNDLHKQVLKNTIFQKMQFDIEDDETPNIQEKIIQLQVQYKTCPNNSPNNKKE